MPKSASCRRFRKHARRTPIFLALLLVAGALPGRTPAASPPLAEKYRQWLDCVDYIITPAERKIFLELDNDRDREAFVSIFWNQRDPNRGTPENEFKDEHLRRFEHANRYFGRSSPLPGWKTDRGRIHIILGPPVYRNEITSSQLFPIEIWDYYGSPNSGLPAMFHVAFYRPEGTGDFKLYVPAIDGPARLLVSRTGTATSQDNEAVYRKILEIKPDVAAVSLSLIPGEQTFGFSPSLRDLTLMAKIADSPKENINTSYASHFSRFQAYVDVQNSVNFIANHHELFLSRDPLSQWHFIHIAIQPERVSVDYSADSKKYFCTYKMVVDVRQGERIVLQTTKKFPFAYDKDDLNKVLARGLVLADRLPVIDGDFEVTVFIQNSVNGEFTSFSETIRVPAAGEAALFGPLLAHDLQRNAQAAMGAFTVADLHANPDPRRTYGERENLQALFVFDPGAGAAEAWSPGIEVVSLPTASAQPETRRFTPQDSGQAVRVLSAEIGALPAGYYRLRAFMRDAAGGERFSSETTFVVSRQTVLAHPSVAAPTLASESPAASLLALASQYEACRRWAEAERAFAAGMAKAAGSPSLPIAFARFLLRREQYARALAVAETIPEAEKTAMERHTLRGLALHNLERHEEAVAELLEANRLYDSDTAVLNALGVSFLRLGNIAEARKALAASLKVRADQPSVAALLRQTEAP